MIYDHAERAKAILNDLIAYSQKPEALVKERCKYSAYELAFLWEKYKDTPEEFYRTTDLYIYDLTMYQSQYVPKVNYMVEAAKLNGFKKVLDLGGGIGEYTIRFTKEAGCQVTYLDMEDSETAKYAAYRMHKAGVYTRMVNEDYNWQSEQWDAVIAMDVIEHMSDEVARKALEGLKKVKYVYCNPDDVYFNDLYPQHITRYSMEDFESIDINLYKNKAL